MMGKQPEVCGNKHPYIGIRCKGVPGHEGPHLGEDRWLQESDSVGVSGPSASSEPRMMGFDHWDEVYGWAAKNDAPEHIPDGTRVREISRISLPLYVSPIAVYSWGGTDATR